MVYPCPGAVVDHVVFYHLAVRNAVLLTLGSAPTIVAVRVLSHALIRLGSPGWPQDSVDYCIVTMNNSGGLLQELASNVHLVVSTI